MGINWSQTLAQPRIRESLARAECPCCGTSMPDSSKVAYYGTFVLVKCACCAFMFVGNPRHALNGYYGDEFARCDPEFHVRGQRENAKVNLRQILRFFELRGITTSGLAALDVGSGFGFLVAGLNHAGFNACGLEPSRFETEYARTMVGIAVFHGFVENFVGVPFDLVV